MIKERDPLIIDPNLNWNGRRTIASKAINCLSGGNVEFRKITNITTPFFTFVGSAPLGSYMTKGSLASSFELGVTKSPSPGSSVSMSPSPTQSSKEEHAKGGDVLVNGNGSGSGSGDPKSLHLTPATDDQTVAWSEGTRATDLLF